MKRSVSWLVLAGLILTVCVGCGAKADPSAKAAVMPKQGPQIERQAMQMPKR